MNNYLNVIIILKFFIYISEKLVLSNCSSSGYVMKGATSTVRVYPKTPVIIQSSYGTFSPLVFMLLLFCFSFSFNFPPKNLVIFEMSETLFVLFPFKNAFILFK